LKRTENEESSRKSALHGAWSFGGESRSVLLLSGDDSSWKRESDLRVQKLSDVWSLGALLLASGVGDWKSFDSEDLDGSRSSSMASTHVSVALSDGTAGHGVSVFTVHVVSSGSGVVSDPDAEVLDKTGCLFGDLLHRDDFSGGLVDLLVVRHKVPESRFGGDWVWREKSNSVDRWVGLRVRRQLSASNDELAKIALCLHF